MSENMPGHIRPETVRLLADVAIGLASGAIIHNELELFVKRHPIFVDWRRVYHALGMLVEYDEFVFDVSNLTALTLKSGFWTVPIIKGVACNKVIAAFKKFGAVVCLYNGNLYGDLDVSVGYNDRDPNKTGSYIVSFARAVEADDNLNNLSADKLTEQGVQGITLPECLILDLGYFMTTRMHLGEKIGTLCSGSRFVAGDVPTVVWNDKENILYVDYLPTNRGSKIICSRAVAS